MESANLLRDKIMQKYSTVREFAEKNMLNETYLSKLVSGRQFPSMEKAYDIAKLLNIDAGEYIFCILKDKAPASLKYLFMKSQKMQGYNQANSEVSIPINLSEPIYESLKLYFKQPLWLKFMASEVLKALFKQEWRKRLKKSIDKDKEQVKHI